jgi:hypothetical protein
MNTTLVPAPPSADTAGGMGAPNPWGGSRLGSSRSRHVPVGVR